MKNIDAERWRTICRLLSQKDLDYYALEGESEAEITAWVDARRTPSASIGEDGLPELPEPWQGFQYNDGWNSWEQVAPFAIHDPHVTQAFTADQMRQYARDAAAAEYQWNVARIQHLTHERDTARAELRAQLARQSQGVAPPVTPEEVVAFIGNHYNKMYDANDVENIIFELTVHDLQSALRWWFDDIAAPPLSSEQQAEKGDGTCGS